MLGDFTSRSATTGGVDPAFFDWLSFTYSEGALTL